MTPSNTKACVSSMIFHISLALSACGTPQIPVPDLAANADSFFSDGARLEDSGLPDLEGEDRADMEQIRGIRFSTPTQLGTKLKLQIQTLAVGDLDGDGNLDILAGGGLDVGADAGIVALFNRGGRGFDLPAVISPFGTIDQPDLVLGDINHDGLLDVAFLRWSGTHFMINQGGRSFGPLQTAPYPVFMNQTAVNALALADINQDGNADIIFVGTPLAGPGTDKVFVDFADGKGGVRMPVAFDAWGTENLATSDLDGDGWPDIITAGATHQGQVLFNDKGVLLPPVGPIFVDQPPVAADMNGDGLPDIVAMRFPHVITITWNLGHRMFGKQDLFPADPCGGDLAAVADMNHDGRPDVVCASGMDYFVLFNLGGGALAAPTKIVHDSGYPCVLADLDGDSKPDLIIASGNNIHVYFNDTP